VWVVVFELSLLVLVLGKLGWDIIVYRQSGRLPWVARHLCFWSVPGISSARYTGLTNQKPPYIHHRIGGHYSIKSILGISSATCRGCTNQKPPLL
jgi:hypothetical protein